jgi:hypothetical protein
MGAAWAKGGRRVDPMVAPGGTVPAFQAASETSRVKAGRRA